MKKTTTTASGRSKLRRPDQILWDDLSAIVIVRSPTVRVLEVDHTAFLLADTGRLRTRLRVLKSPQLSRQIPNRMF